DPIFRLSSRAECVDVVQLAMAGAPVNCRAPSVPRNAIIKDRPIRAAMAGDRVLFVVEGDCAKAIADVGVATVGIGFINPLGAEVVDQVGRAVLAVYDSDRVAGLVAVELIILVMPNRADSEAMQ